MNNLPKVQKSNKKCKLNGFSLYAIELNGRKVEDSDKTYVTGREIEKAKSSWNSLTQTQRVSYNERAKKFNIKISNTQIRYNSLGQNISDVDAQRARLEEEENRRKHEIKYLVKNAAEMGELDNKIFYFVSASSFYEDYEQIYPAEIAFSKFSLTKGVFDFMSLEINPGELPLGSAYLAQTKANETHKYNLPPDFFGESDYLNVLTKIVDFMPNDESFPILFTEGFGDIPNEDKKLKDTKRILKLIFEKAQEYQMASELKVYSVIELFYYLKEVTTEAWNDVDPNCREVSFFNFTDAFNKFKIANEEFIYTAGTCEYHYGREVMAECCLNKCLCYGYIISKWCAQGFKYLLRPGYHYPKNHVLKTF